ncbi:N-formyl-4-amino-5-aminomethyl-2-methylpyrimidine deformylase [Neomoorella glycerini]|uniref:N-formyl-4-amino-5-aminomethyl-2-methylpyrimidine deformylase n=1 Tax=Neomoorella glycerini TaxID=55779 RepID=A0A6I5ZT91_9FIRM|nr:YgeY family selenium metabolism-linked hydrolase [Moorella glycerini]QGP93130.1 N-formyl-4-amino-5-aminomethyl-2-methylpyrimidine deformylase [Moorella glycerini]
MIQAPSITGQEKNIASLVQQEMVSLGYTETWIDELGNVIGRVAGRGQGPAILFDGHLDTVDVAEPGAWQHPPFQGRLVDGRIYGRGAADMKGALAAMVCAIGFLAQDGVNRGGDLYVTGTVVEEVAEGVALSHILKKIRPAAVVIGEATGLNLNFGQRGRAEIILETRGRPAHSANPEVGVNAVYKMLPLVEAVRHLELPMDPLLGPAIMELTDIISSPYPGASVVPQGCRATYDRRLLVGEEPDQVLAPLQAIISASRLEDPELEAEAMLAPLDITTYTGRALRGLKFAPAWCIDKGHPLVAAAREALFKASLQSPLGTYRFCTNGSGSMGNLGIPTVGFGPGRESQAHVSDEYIEVDELLAAAKGYYSLAGTLSTRGW